MLSKLKSVFSRVKNSQGNATIAREDGEIPTDNFKPVSCEEQIHNLYANAIQQPPPTPVTPDGSAMDSGCSDFPLGATPTFISPSLVSWYSSQSFIGYTMCAILAQQWMIDKSCTMPAEDASRNGYELTINSGEKISVSIKDDVREYDTRYKLNYHMLEFVRKHLIFGIRVAMFKVESRDPKYYEKPFNIDGITPGSYKGIRQIDPYWITPQLSGAAASNPAAIDFYEPTYWRVGALRVHRTHLVIINTGDVPDILKPTYYYGGVSLPQKIYERVYQAERTANEGPQLALTKRTDIYKTDLAKMVQNQAAFEQKIARQAYNRDNYGIKVIGLEEEMSRMDTALADLDAVIMTQYQLVAAIANVPSTKLLSASPKGFNPTGEYEEASYHEYLSSIQSHKLTPLLTRHYEILIRSEIAPKYGIQPFDFKIAWNSCDSMTAEEEANINKSKSETAVNYANVGAIDGQDERDRIIADPKSGYNGLNLQAPVLEIPDEESSEFGGARDNEEKD